MQLLIPKINTLVVEIEIEIEIENETFLCCNSNIKKKRPSYKIFKKKIKTMNPK